MFQRINLVLSHTQLSPFRFDGNEVLQAVSKFGDKKKTGKKRDWHIEVLAKRPPTLPAYAVSNGNNIEELL